MSTREPRAALPDPAGSVGGLTAVFPWVDPGAAPQRAPRTGDRVIAPDPDFLRHLSRQASPAHRQMGYLLWL